MTPEQFLDLLEERKLVPDHVVARLRGQVANTSKPVTARSLVKLLVEKLHLTSAQGKGLLKEIEQAERQGAGGEDELGYAILDDEQPAAAGSSGSAASSGAAGTEPRPTGKGRVRDAWRLEAEPKNPIPTIGTLDDLFAEATDANTAATVPAGQRRWWWQRGRGPAKYTSGRWDTPLMLLGGGGLALLIIVGGVLWWRIGQQSAEQLLQKAQDSYRGGSYTQAIDQYDKFLEHFPDHAQASHVRVQRGLAQLRQATDHTSAWPQALGIAQRVIPSISSEAEFGSARAELADILPKIVEGLATHARRAADQASPELPPEKAQPLVAEAQEHLAKTREAMALLEHYVVASMRPAQRVRDAQTLIATTERDLRRTGELEKALAEIEQAIGAKQPDRAYAVQRRLIREYPALADNEALRGQLSRLNAVLLELARSEADSRPAVADEPESPIETTIVPAVMSGGAAPLSEGSLVTALVDGAIYGLDGPSGKLLWRRYVGFDTDFVPVPVSSEPGADVIAVDSVRQEVQRIDGRSGELRWRQPIGDRLLQPSISREVLLAATAAGRIAVIHLESGAIERSIFLPQPLAVGPTVDSRRPHFYQVAEHSNLYAIDRATGACREVMHLGHAPGAVRVPPALVLRYVVVAENHSEKNSRLHVLSTDAEGLQLRPAQQVELEGRVLTSPAVAGNRLVVTTDRGGIYVLDVGEAEGQEPLTLVAKQLPTGDQPLVRFPLLEVGRLWLADNRWTHFDLQAARGRIDPRSVQHQGDVFVQPPVKLEGGTALLVRKPADRAGAAVAIVSLGENGPPAWETRIAAPASGLPVRLAGSWVASSASGQVYRLEPGKAGAAHMMSAQPAESGGNGEPRTNPIWLDHVEPLDPRAALATSSESRDRALVIGADDQGKIQAQWTKFPGLESPACRPVAFAGQIMVCDEAGQIHLLDRDGERAAVPFQPKQHAGERFAWQQPGVSEDGRSAVVADGGLRVFRLELVAAPHPHLQAAATTELAEPIISPVAVAGQAASAFDARGWLVTFSLPGLEQAGTINLGAKPVWGPVRCGDHMYAATDKNDLICVDGRGQLRWKIPLVHGPLAGPPLETEQGVVLATTRGVIYEVSQDAGSERGSVELGVPLATGCTQLEHRLLVGGHDGAWHLIAGP